MFAYTKCINMWIKFFFTATLPIMTGHKTVGFIRILNAKCNICMDNGNKWRSNKKRSVKNMNKTKLYKLIFIIAIYSAAFTLLLISIKNYTSYLSTYKSNKTTQHTKVLSSTKHIEKANCINKIQKNFWIFSHMKKLGKDA